MPKIIKEKKKYSFQKLYLETNQKLKELSVKRGQYIIEILADLAEREYNKIFDK